VTHSKSLHDKNIQSSNELMIIPPYSKQDPNAGNTVSPTVEVSRCQGQLWECQWLHSTGKILINCMLCYVNIIKVHTNAH